MISLPSILSYGVKVTQNSADFRITESKSANTGSIRAPLLSKHRHLLSSKVSYRERSRTPDRPLNCHFLSQVFIFICPRMHTYVFVFQHHFISFRLPMRQLPTRLCPPFLVNPEESYRKPDATRKRHTRPPIGIERRMTRDHEPLCSITKPSNQTTSSARPPDSTRSPDDARQSRSVQNHRGDDDQRPPAGETASPSDQSSPQRRCSAPIHPGAE